MPENTIIYSLPAVELAPLLLGSTLISEIGGVRTGGIITEVEAYHQDEPASHSHRGETARNSSMFRPGGTLYVYFIYGMHHCVNVVSGEEGLGEAVLIRSIRPTIGLPTIQSRRGTHVKDADLTNGPGKLTQALGIGREHDGINLLVPSSPVAIIPGSSDSPSPHTRTPRIGISQAQDLHWRFVLAHP